MDVVWADAIPLANASVDRILFRNTLHHILNVESLYAEFGQLIKPGGLMLLQASTNMWEKTFSGFLTDLHLMMDNTLKRYSHAPQYIVNDLIQYSISC